MTPKPKPRVFLDSNVIFSGLYSPKGAPGIILEHFIRGEISVVISQQVLEEVIRTVKEKIPDTLPALRRLLVSAPPEVIADPKPERIERLTGRLPIGDAAILGAAIAAKPEYFVTGDNHFLKKAALVEETGLNIVTPAQFLKLTELEET
jgi:putative PIN family toxin of toxin-antitoxin system